MDTLHRRPSGLWVASDAQDERSAQAELGRIDDRLFLDQEYVKGGICYVVKLHQGDREPHVVCYWTDEHGQPLPLSSALAEKVRSLDRNAQGPQADAATRAREANDQLMQKMNDESHDDYAAVTDDARPFLVDTRSGVLPRSTALRMSRDRQRAKGRKV